MEDLLLDFFEKTINYKKLKKSRKERKLSLAEVSTKTGIPTTTLQRYEDGVTKNVPLEAIKKLCKLYKTDYAAYYNWTTFPLFKNLSGILIGLFNKVPIPIYTKPILGDIFEKLEITGEMKIFAKFSQEEDVKNSLYKTLTKEEQQKYDDFELISKTILKTNEIFALNEEERKEVEKLLFITFLFHKIRKKNKEKVINFEEVETFEK